MKINEFGLHGQSRVDVTGEILASRAAAPSSEVVARAEALLGRPGKAIGEDRFAAVVACGLLFHSANRSAAEALDFVQHQGVCEPPLDPSKLRDAIYVAFFEPEIADRIVADALSTHEAPAVNPPPVELVQAVEPPSQPAAHATTSPAAAPAGRPEAIVHTEADLPADRQRLTTGRETGTAEQSADVGRSRGSGAPMAAAERMRRRRAELKRLGLPAKWKGNLKAAVTPSSVTSAGVTPKPPDGVTPREHVTPVTPSCSGEVANVQ